MKNIKSLLVSTVKSFPAILVSVAVVTTVVYASSSLTAPAGNPTPTAYTLTDIYNRLNTNATSTATNHSLSTTTAPAPSGFTLTQIYSAIPTIDATKVATGTSYLGITGSAYSAKQLVTNQTICYDAAGSVIACSGTGQDGELLKGVARSYTDNGDGTILDNSTGLIWQKQDDAVTRNWADSLTYCNANTAALPGSGWRLPNVYELYTLVDFGVQAAPFINLTYFPATQSNFYWASTSRPGTFTVAMGVNFGIGVAGSSTKSILFYVRCVRG